ncbi:hypothetical protein [Henriciella litoralis]|uniref:hypothetical protein n=1 Tax=Henriciella litoralis TaxID=568102 RepID=UPI0009FBE231|nr:hypothetical protein [Henriciella litoralis]
MKHVVIFLFAASLTLTAQASEICRSVSSSWQEDGQQLQTRISTQARDGCKLIFQSVNDVETEGVDCNCDLVIDGMEGQFSPPPSARQAERLLETCHGPSTDPKPERQEIYIVN